MGSMQKSKWKQSEISQAGSGDLGEGAGAVHVSGKDFEGILIRVLHLHKVGTGPKEG